MGSEIVESKLTPVEDVGKPVTLHLNARPCMVRTLLFLTELK